MNATLYIKRRKNFNAMAVEFDVFIDGEQAGSIANNLGKTFSIPAGTHDVYIKLGRGVTSPTLLVQAGDGDSIFLECGLRGFTTLFLMEDESQVSNNVSGQTTRAVLVNQTQSGTSLKTKNLESTDWFFCIGGVSILNSLIHLLGGRLSLYFGLGITQFIDAVIDGYTKDLPDGNRATAAATGFVINMVIAGVFIAAGYLGKKRHRWAVIAGMILYALDAIVLLMFGAWLDVGFHVLTLWYVWRGLQATNQLNSLKAVEGAFP